MKISKARCKRCKKKWCGTNKQLIKLYGGRWDEKTYGSKKCRDKATRKIQRSA